MLNKFFRFYGQRVLPLVYDDSLSYYEMLGKLTHKINEVIENNNLLEQYMGAYMPTYNGEWDNSNVYPPLSVVSYNGDLYMAKQEVPVGIAINSAEYWEQVELPYSEAIYNLSELDVLHPDLFEGTDSGKLQQAFDSLATSGGTICINRKYSLNANVIIKHLSSRQKNFIHVIGIGKNAEIDFNGYTIGGDRVTGENYGSNSVGGIYWQDINFTGQEGQNGFITDRLIRMFFTGCHFYGLSRAFYGNDSFTFNNVSRPAYAQSYYFSQCYFGAIKTNAFDVYKVFDCHFTNCVFEYDRSAINIRGAVEGLYIISCLLENITSGAAITVRAGTDSNGCYNLGIRDCYFEDNAISIDIRNVGYSSCSIIENCMCSINSSGQLFIYMPRNLQDPYGNNRLHPALTIRGNSLVPTSYLTGSDAMHFDLFHEDGVTPWMWQLTHLKFEDNNFELTNSNASMEQLYTLNYRPENKTYTKRDRINVYTRFSSSGGSTITTAANKPLDVAGSCYTIVSLKDTQTGQDICRDANGTSEDPNTWYDVLSLSGTGIALQIKQSGGSPVVDRDLLATRAGDKNASLILEWKYTIETAPTT